VQAFEKLEPFIEQLTRDRKNSTKSEDGEARYVVALALRANLLRDLNRNAESIESQEALLKLMEGLTSKASRLMRLEVETNYSQSLAQSGDSERAFTILNAVMEGYQRLVADFPEDPMLKIQSTTAANNLGTTLVGKGGHREALQVFVDSIGLLRKINDPAHFENRDRKLALLLQNAAFAASMVGDPTQARTYIEESLALSEKLGQQDTKDAIRAKMTLGAILARLNQYGESAETYGKLIDQLRRLYPETRYPNGTVDLAIVLDNRAVSLVRLDKVEEAIPLATEASRMFESLAQDSPSLKLNAARSGANVALLNAQLGNSEAAASGLDRAITLYEEMFPDGHPEMPGLYRSKAINLSQLRRESESIEAAEKALELARDSFPGEVYPFGHGILAQALDSTGLIYLAAGQPEKAGKYFEQAVQMHGRLADETLKHISEAESLQFLAVADAFKSHLLSVPVDSKRAYALLASEKGRILAQQRRRFQAARDSQDPATAELLEKYQLIRGQLARAVLTPTSNPRITAAVRKLQADREEIERQIAQAADSEKTEDSGSVRKSLFSSITSDVDGDVNLDQRIREIPKGTTVFEFFSYEHYSINDEALIRRTEGSQKLSAFVLVGGSPEVRRVDFGETMGLRQQTRRLVVAMQFGTEREPLAEVSQFVCSKLCPVIPQDCTKLVIIPDGITSAIPFACLIDPSREKSLVESFELTIQSSLHRPARNGQALLSDQSKVVAV
jgi:tetratricopeptide (TPR) repeat protein